MSKKYEMIKEGNMFRIKALRSFGSVLKGTLGGLIEKEDNLSQNGDAQVFGDARVSGNARVFVDAQVFGDARVSGNAQVFGNALVSKPTDIRVQPLERFTATLLPKGVQVGCEFKTFDAWLELESHPEYTDQRQFDRDHALLCLAIHCYLDLKDSLKEAV